jgi:hypothetical protein
VREKVTEKERRLFEEELRNLFSAANNIRTIKSRMVGWARFIAYVEAMINAAYFLSKHPETTLNILSTWEDNIKIYF